MVLAMEPTSKAVWPLRRKSSFFPGGRQTKDPQHVSPIYLVGFESGRAQREERTNEGRQPDPLDLDWAAETRDWRYVRLTQHSLRIATHHFVHSERLGRNNKK